MKKNIDLEKSIFEKHTAKWKVVENSLLIESILLNIPINPIYFFENENMILEVIDGWQRLTCLKNFYNNEFKLNGLRFLTELENRNYSNLPPKYKNLLNHYLLRMVIIKHGSDPKIKFDLFNRINGIIKI